MIKLILISLSVFFIVVSSACQKSTSSNENDLELDAFIEEQAAIGWEINDLVLSSNEITELTGNEPSSFTAVSDVYYSNDFMVSHLRKSI